MTKNTKLSSVLSAIYVVLLEIISYYHVMRNILRMTKVYSKTKSAKLNLISIPYRPKSKSEVCSGVRTGNIINQNVLLLQLSIMHAEQSIKMSRAPSVHYSCPSVTLTCQIMNFHRFFAQISLFHVSEFVRGWGQNRNTIASVAHKLSHLVGKPTMWFPNRSDTNPAVQAQKQARNLKFRI